MVEYYYLLVIRRVTENLIDINSLTTHLKKSYYTAGLNNFKFLLHYMSKIIHNYISNLLKLNFNYLHKRTMRPCLIKYLYQTYYYLTSLNSKIVISLLAINTKYFNHSRFDFD